MLISDNTDVYVTHILTVLFLGVLLYFALNACDELLVLVVIAQQKLN